MLQHKLTKCPLWWRVIKDITILPNLKTVLLCRIFWERNWESVWNCFGISWEFPVQCSLGCARPVAQRVMLCTYHFVLCIEFPVCLRISLRILYVTFGNILVTYLSQIFKDSWQTHTVIYKWRWSFWEYQGCSKKWYDQNHNAAS